VSRDRDHALIYSIGHSTRPIEEFVALLQAYDVMRLADIRTVPASRRHPQFAKAALATYMAEHGIEYLHLPGLGGLRKPRRDSPNSAWRHEGFRGYADYMETPTFDQSLDDLLEWANAPGRASGATAMMCAEAVWWQCHRKLVADALLARGVEVRHIMSASSAPPHELTEFARVIDKRVSYRGLLG